MPISAENRKWWTLGAAALVRPHLDLGALSGPAASAEGRV